MKQRQGCIYLLRCLAGEQKGYIGQYAGTEAERRWAAHIRCANRASKYPIHRAIRKYGVENFSAQVIWRGHLSALNAKEIYYIAKFHTFISDPKGGGYNLTKGGMAKNGWVTPDSVRAQIKATNIATYKNNPALKAGQAANQLGRHHTATTKNKLSVSVKKVFANNPELGLKVGDRCRGKTLTAEHRAKLVAAKVGWAPSRAHKNNLSKAGFEAWENWRMDRLDEVICKAVGAS